MFYTVYKITNTINGKEYIGSHKTSNLDDGYMGSGKYLRSAQVKHGIENFKKEILFIFDNAADMYNKEAELVTEEYLTSGNTYNLKAGGFGGFDYLNSENFENATHTFEHMSKMSRAAKEKYPKEFWSAHSTRIGLTHKSNGTGICDPNNRGSFKSKQHTVETKQKIGKATSVAQTGTGNSQYGTIWVTDGISNKKLPSDAIIPDGWIKGRVIAKRI